MVMGGMVISILHQYITFISLLSNIAVCESKAVISNGFE